MLRAIEPLGGILPRIADIVLVLHVKYGNDRSKFSIWPRMSTESACWALTARWKNGGSRGARRYSGIRVRECCAGC